MTDKERSEELVKKESDKLTKIPLGPSASIDISSLPEEERKALVRDYAKGMVDIGLKASELHVEADALKRTLDDLSGTTKEVSDTGNAVTVTHTQTTKSGRTEVMMGNTEQAQSGKLSKSQTGENDWTPFYVVGGIIALIVIASIIF